MFITTSSNKNVLNQSLSQYAIRNFIGLLEGEPPSSKKPVHLIMRMPMGEHDLTATCIDCAKYRIGDDLGAALALASHAAIFSFFFLATVLVTVAVSFVALM